MLLKVVLLFTVSLMVLRNEVLGGLTVKKFPHPLHEDMKIHINLDLYSMKDYAIYLQEAGTNGAKYGDVHLHVSFKNYDDNDGMVRTHLVLNSQEKGEWHSDDIRAINGHQLYNVRVPFMTITTKLDHYEIVLDKENIHIFKYRKPVEDLEKIQYLVLRGEFWIKRILLNDEIDMASEEYDVKP